jgi:hypothetical protein
VCAEVANLPVRRANAPKKRILSFANSQVNGIFTNFVPLKHAKQWKNS